MSHKGKFIWIDYKYFWGNFLNFFRLSLFVCPLYCLNQNSQNLRMNRIFHS